MILLLGARLNWILHFGAEPRYSKDVKFIQVDICAEEIANNWPSTGGHAGLVGDIKSVVEQMIQCVPTSLTNANSKWLDKLQAKVAKNQQVTANLISLPSKPYMSYYHAFDVIRRHIGQMAEPPVIVGEGANTMDIGRTMLNQV